MAAEPVPRGAERGRAQADRSSGSLRRVSRAGDGASGKGCMFSRQIGGGQAAVGSVPARDAVEGGEDERRCEPGVDSLEFARPHSFVDHIAESGFVGITPLQDGVAARFGQMAPFMDEDTGKLRVVGDHTDMGPDERGEPFSWSRVRHRVARICRRSLEGGRGSVDDRPQDVLLRRDVRIEAGALDVERPGDVADAGRRVPALAEETARHALDRPASGTGFDYHVFPSYLTFVRRPYALPRATVKWCVWPGPGPRAERVQLIGGVVRAAPQGRGEPPGDDDDDRDPPAETRGNGGEAENRPDPGRAEEQQGGQPDDQAVRIERRRCDDRRETEAREALATAATECREY